MALSGFRAVNTSLGVEDRSFGRQEETTPTTPRPNNFTSIQEPAVPADESTPNTPTRNSFGGISGQRPLPLSTSSFESPIPQKRYSDSPSVKGTLTRENSHRSAQSSESQDVDMDDSEEEDGSDTDSIDAESGRPSKKKKGQRFFCTDFPPCTLSFTRSEHLARHIRFSRLDNLRQHAQTVHVNEEIPGDSLAATGTRFQRQIRTDRVRPPGNRSRASTVGSQSSHGRGHSRNLSSSSIGSSTSTVSQREDSRRRPPPLIMANDSGARARLSLDTFRSPPTSPANQYVEYANHSPGGFSTPTSSTFSAGPSSPRFPSGLGSPMSTASRNAGLWASKSHGRRLSVPSGANPFQAPHGNTYPPPYLSPLTSTAGSIYSPSGSMFGSPTSSTFAYSRHESFAAADAEWRRRTWHPSTYSGLNARPVTSGLSYFQTPDSPQPAFAPQAAAGQATRLPGIESFDQHVRMRPSTPPGRGPSPMQLDTPSRPPIFPGPIEQSTSGPDNRRGHAQWDMSLHQNLTRLDIANATPPKESTIQWGPSLSAEAKVINNTPRPNTAPQPAAQSQPRPVDNRPVPISTDSHEDFAYRPQETPKRSKRMGWYNGPLSGANKVSFTHRTSPGEDSSSSDGVPTPSTSSLGEYHPSIVHSNGYIEGSPAGVSTVEPQHGFALSNTPGTGSVEVNESETALRNRDMGRLEALVAVATSEDKAANAAF
ncbi:MAG: hypothetical protein M1827_001752 [Pycnora praestabilis]|nr:MAG: hypothetical protein M1827_001752 [Pycnora praestabilis]